MKLSKDFEIKKRMASVAEPILEVFLSDKTPEERKKVLRDIIKRTGITRERDKEVILEMSRNHGFTGELPNEGYGSYSFFNGNIKLSTGARNCTYVHELAHYLHEYLGNHYVLANSLDCYFSTYNFFKYKVMREIYKIQFKKSGVRHRKNLRGLHSFEKTHHPDIEYKFKFNETGIDLGIKAACLERDMEIDGSGLFYLRLVDSGVDFENAEKEVRFKNADGMNEFARKFGKRMKRLLEGGK